MPTAATIGGARPLHTTGRLFGGAADANVEVIVVSGAVAGLTQHHLSAPDHLEILIAGDRVLHQQRFEPPRHEQILNPGLRVGHERTHQAPVAIHVEAHEAAIVASGQAVALKTHETGTLHRSAVGVLRVKEQIRVPSSAV